MIKNKRESTIVKTSVIGILANILLVIMKALVGFLSNSIAIISDAINNLSDALSSIITIIGTKYAAKKADRDHPYGYGRAEHITSLVVSAIVLYAGITALIESIKAVINGETVDYSAVTVIVLIIGIIGKFLLGFYVKNKGKKIKSDALRASGVDAINDGLLSIAVLAAVIIYLIFNINIEAYISILVSVYIIKAGLDLVKESVDNVIGRRPDKRLINRIKKEIMRNRSVFGVYDIVLNDYGPDKYMGSAHIELSSDLTVKDVDKISRKITKSIFEEFGVMLHTIGVYAVNRKDEKTREIHDEVEKIVFSFPNILEMHGFSLDKKQKIMTFDIVFDFKEKESERIRQKILEAIKKKYPEYKINIILDIDTSTS